MKKVGNIMKTDGRKQAKQTTVKILKNLEETFDGLY